ncbi:glycosyltransferase family 2 protein [Marilutibacter chinensis]|uniref:Glycosyltransferase family 2 protein n=1 Tax=Marilutibacter chinensis TaxID=2912247 RepID=A0ABS9HRF8_9GAMM|nr:glycosyltransferase family 2 protein [Lysobacter chinensis]MCF7220935.1 glycosyltransferase family 2 protein [Lysobacter chinensis]
MTEPMFWMSVAGVVLAYAGYPAYLVLRRSLDPWPVVPRAWTPPVDVLLVVHNAGDALEAKVANLQRLDYPAQRLTVHVVCDGCTDATAAVARRLASGRVRATVFAERRGKSACIGDLLPTLTGDVVLFVDVRQTLAPHALRALTAALADPSVGAASGELVIRDPTGFAAGVDAYWRYEKAIRRLESATGSMVGATGALYAARRQLIGPVPPGLILDDMWIPLSVADAGYRIVAVDDAIAVDHAPPDPAAEERRKRRTLSGNYQLLHRLPRLALPGAHPLSLRLWGHKWSRLLVPWLLATALASSALLAAAGSRLYLTLFLLQAGAYALAILGRRSAWLAGRFPPARVAAAFLSLNASAALALGDYLRNPRAHLWQTTRYQESGR